MLISSLLSRKCIQSLNLTVAWLLCPLGRFGISETADFLGFSHTTETDNTSFPIEPPWSEIMAARILLRLFHCYLIIQVVLFLCSKFKLLCLSIQHVFSSLAGRVMACAPEGSVDSKAELTALLEQWEREQQGSTQDLVTILTKWEFAHAP